MSFYFRRSVPVGRRRRTRVSVSKTGLSGTVRVGPFSVSSRGRIAGRIGRGFGWRR